jgi:undecaprenyl diphosphate synthase
MKIPAHIAIIMDGNGRWGKKNKKSRIAGHYYGVKNIKPIIEYAINIKLRQLSLFALSYDNMQKRNKSEIKNIFFIMKKYLEENLNFFKENGIFLNFIGEKKKIPKQLLNLINLSSAETKSLQNKLQINIAFNYSSKYEMVSAIKNINLLKLKINKKNIENSLYTKNIKDPEILIRTGGYKRLSDFLLWQLSYTEFFFLKKLWPDFKIKDLEKIILKYNHIKRNFGS